jgi:hypothetical protein
MSRDASRGGKSEGRAGAGRWTSAARGGSGGGGSGGGGAGVGGASARPWGEPTAATAGTRLTTYVFGCSVAQ